MGSKIQEFLKDLREERYAQHGKGGKGGKGQSNEVGVIITGRQCNGKCNGIVTVM